MTGGAPASGSADDAEWRALALPRPEPLPDAPRVSVGDVTVVGPPGSGPRVGGVTPGLALQELVSLALLSRRDVRFVERRRFAEAAARERASRPAPAGAPRAGVSEEADLLATAAWTAVPPSPGRVDVRVAHAATGRIVATWSGALAPRAPLPQAARTMVAGLLAALDEGPGRPGTAPPPDATARISDGAVAAFLQGLEAEERWSWDEARSAYLRAAGAEGFDEAGAALARLARLRMGGTLGRSFPP